MFDQFVVSPLNFLLYNRNSENLSEHGLHPRYLHILVNLPLLFGPLIAFLLLFVFMVLYIKNKAHRLVMIMLFLSTVTPLALLSMFPHQEPR
ncbi:hypothetical protein EB796_024100 [Bugula neritina]|uniref:Mannosyltransferase n=1 Tax=Bugula neritina TaxID=10212 RepID=A0A7J7IUM0_BUGNE|nr:hypothetical protein EB796_024100 [Bugula neritina]